MKKEYLYFLILALFTIFSIYLLSSPIIYTVSAHIYNVTSLTPANNSWTNGNNNTIEFNFTMSGNETTTCTLFIDFVGYGTNITESLVANDSIGRILANDSIADGTRLWNINCTDGGIGGVNASEVRTLRVDATSPSVTLATVANNEWSNNTLVTFGVTVTETNNQTCILYGDFAGSWATNQTKNFVSGAQMNFTAVALAENKTGYKWNVLCNDSAGNSAWASANRTVKVDITNPATPTLTCTPSSVTQGGTVTCSCSGSSDSGSGINVSKGSNGYTFTASPSTATVGSFTEKCYVYDNATNGIAASATYTVVSPGGSQTGGGGGVSQWKRSYALTETQFTSGYNQQLKAKERVKVKVNNEDHYVGVLSLTDISAQVQVTSTPQETTLNVGGEAKFDVTDDNYYDIKIKLESIRGNKATLNIKSIHEQVPEAEEEGEEGEGREAGEEEGEGTAEALRSMFSKWWFWIIVGAVIIAVIIIFVILPSLKKPKKGY